jgi:hypothetical protein
LAKFIWQGRVFKGSPLFGASTATQVTVVDKADSTLASLWSDRDGTTTKANPFYISDIGKLEFYANAGRYKVTAVNGGESDVWDDVLVIDPDAGGGGGGGTVDTVVAGDGVDVDSSDSANPVVSSDFTTGDTDASYTLAAVNDNQWMDIAAAAAGSVNITCPPESSVDLGAKFVHVISNYTSQTVTIVAGSGVTVRPPPGGTLVLSQYSTIGIKKASYAADTYIVFGLTEAS